MVGWEGGGLTNLVRVSTPANRSLQKDDNTRTNLPGMDLKPLFIEKSDTCENIDFLLNI